MVHRSLRFLALLALLLAAVSGFGVDAGHRAEHAFAADLAEAPRFDAGHEAPISEEHVEAARPVAGESCFTCALRSPDPTEARRFTRSSVAAPAVETTSGDNRFAPSADAVRLPLGRAPPA